MSESQNCLLRCIRAIAADARSGPRPYLQNRIAPHARSSTTSRRYTTQSRRNYQTQHNEPDDEHFPPETDVTTQRSHALVNGVPKIYTRGVPEKYYDPAKFWINKNKLRRVSPDFEAARLASLTLAEEKSIRKELQYIQDPLKLADHVRQTLKRGDIKKAFGLCRLASRDMECVVSWNHIIGYLLSEKQSGSALKTYNEMKKRAQYPDSHTYLILLRGLSEPPIHADKVGKALSIYYSLGSENSRVKPTTIHTNAALRVCARAYDIDSLWGIAARIPEQGAGSADPYTYTTILNAIKEHALLNSGSRKDDSQVIALRKTATQQGRRIWGDIIGKWRSGDVMVNEEMVGSMGRLLLSGLEPTDWDDILSLIEQTMEIPRLIPKLGSKMREPAYLSLYAHHALKKELELRDEDENPETEFDRKLVLDSKGKGSVRFVKPGNNTLSLVLEACMKMNAIKAAYEYWDFLLDEHTYNVHPDMDNFHAYLRILRLSRNSSRALDIIQNTMPAFGMVPVSKTWRIAMSSCVRDKHNPNVMKHAHTLFDLMEQHKAEPDPRTLGQYVDVALSTQKAEHISETILRLTDSISKMKSLMSFGKVGSGTTAADDKRDIVAFLRTIIGAIDQMTRKKLVLGEERVKWEKRRDSMHAFIKRFTGRMKDKKVIPEEGMSSLRRSSRQLGRFRHGLREKEKAANTRVSDKNDFKSESLPDFPIEA